MATSDTTFTTRLGRGAAMTIAAGALVLGAAGCSVTIGPGAAPQPSESADGLGEVPASPSATPAAGKGKGADKQGGTGTGWNDNGGHNTATATPPAPSGPRIVYFKIKQKPQCPQGTNVNPIPGVPVTIEWKVERAHQVDLSVDGPGRYSTYGTEGTETLSFGCSGDPGTTVTHTYTIKTIGGGQPVSKTITASAVVYEIAQV